MSADEPPTYKQAKHYPVSTHTHTHMYPDVHPNIIVHVENVVSLFSSPSTSSQKVQKCGQLVSSSLLDRVLVTFYHCFSGVAQVCRDAAGK